MKTGVLFAWCGLIALAATACSSARDQQTGTAWCFNCHSETTPLGQKILWAQAGWKTSVHAEGQVERLYTQNAALGACPPFVQPTAATCTSNGGAHAGAAGGNICTMPAITTQAQCIAATVGSTSPFAAWVDATDPLATPGACPSFAQFKASPTAAATPCENVFGAAAYDITTFRCTPAAIAPATYVTQNACQSAGGSWVGPTYVLTGVEHSGTNAFYANSGGCQMCHTEQGFRKRVSGQYDDPNASPPYSIQFGPATAAWTGSPSAATNTPLTRDTILNPAPIGCFACHTPHGIGSPDGVHLDQAVPVGTPVTTQLGAVWGSNKAKGHICAECHQALMRNAPSVIAAITGQVTGASGRAFIGSYFGTHHGPQADMNLGTGGAQYAGSATGTAGTFTFAGTYGNSPHTGNPNADCVSCHMQSDYQDINVTSTFGVDASVGGHSFTNKGFVHGAEKALALGCGSTGCHTVSGVTGSSGTLVAAASIARTLGYLQAGDAYFKKSTSSTSMVDSNYQFKVNELLTKLANPSANCTGLITAAATLPAVGAGLSWATMPDGVTVDPRCLFNGSTVGLPKAAAPADDNTNASVRILKALWNFGFVSREDKSFGVHNTTYALQLLYDSCMDLAVLTGKDCGPTAGQCSYCQTGPFVTARAQ